MVIGHALSGGVREPKKAEPSVGALLREASEGGTAVSADLDNVRIFSPRIPLQQGKTGRGWESWRFWFCRRGRGVTSRLRIH